MCMSVCAGGREGQLAAFPSPQLWAKKGGTSHLPCPVRSCLLRDSWPQPSPDTPPYPSPIPHTIPHTLQQPSSLLVTNTPPPPHTHTGTHTPPGTHPWSWPWPCPSLSLRLQLRNAAAEAAQPAQGPPGPWLVRQGGRQALGQHSSSKGHPLRLGFPICKVGTVIPLALPDQYTLTPWARVPGADPTGMGDFILFS